MQPHRLRPAVPVSAPVRRGGECHQQPQRHHPGRRAESQAAWAMTGVVFVDLAVPRDIDPAGGPAAPCATLVRHRPVFQAPPVAGPGDGSVRLGGRSFLASSRFSEFLRPGRPAGIHDPPGRRCPPGSLPGRRPGLPHPEPCRAGAPSGCSKTPRSADPHPGRWSPPQGTVLEEAAVRRPGRRRGSRPSGSASRNLWSR